MAAALVSACGSAARSSVSQPAGEGAALPTPRTDAVAAAGGAPLASIAAERVLLMPTQRTRIVADGGTVGTTRTDTAVTNRLDAALVEAFAEREVSAKWALPVDARRTFRRNPMTASDPDALAVGPLLPANAPRRRTSEPPAVREPLASQLRMLAALTDARYVLLPVELRMETAGLTAGSARATLHLVLIDVRLSQVRWAGDVAGDALPMSADPAAAARIVAARAASLVAGPV